MSKFSQTMPSLSVNMGKTGKMVKGGGILAP